MSETGELRREQPHFLAHCKDGSSWLLRPKDWDDFAGYWMAGKAFWSGVDHFGSPVVIKLGDVTGMSAKNDEVLALLDAEAEIERQRAILTDSAD